MSHVRHGIYYPQHWAQLFDELLVQANKKEMLNIHIASPNVETISLSWSESS